MACGVIRNPMTRALGSTEIESKRNMSRHLSNSLHYGVREGNLLHVSEVSRGLSCGCVCPACGVPLVAKQGRLREHHFAHSTGEPCQYAGETSLHLVAKKILLKRKEIVLPAVQLQFYNKTLSIAPEKRYQVDSISVEQRVENIVPDVLAQIGNRLLLVEIRVTHGVDDQKIRRIKELGVSAVEIDLSDAPRDLPPEDLEELIVEGGAHKIWLYNIVSARRREQEISKATARPTIYRGLARHVDGCPLPARVWNGKPYANVIDDCTGCEHALEFSREEAVICGA